MMVIWRGSLSRCGGTVCDRIIIWILSRHGITPTKTSLDKIVQIQNKPVSNIENGGMDAISLESRSLDMDYFMGGNDGYYTNIFHMPFFYIHFVRRDLRPSILSHMRLTSIPFDVALEWLPKKMALYDKFEALPNERCLKLDYEKDIIDLSSGIRKLSEFIGFPLSDGDLLDASKLFSKDLLRRRFEDEHERFYRMMHDFETSQNFTRPAIRGGRLVFSMDHDGVCSTYKLPFNTLDDESLGKMRQGEIPGGIKINVAGNSYGLMLNQDIQRLTFRAAYAVSIDGQTVGFQQEHISSNENDDWRTLLTREQLDRMNSMAMPFLEKYGYPI